MGFGGSCLCFPSLSSEADDAKRMEKVRGQRKNISKKKVAVSEPMKGKTGKKEKKKVIISSSRSRRKGR